MSEEDNSNFFGQYQNTLNEANENVSQLRPSLYENIFKIGFDDLTPFYNLTKTIIIPNDLDPNLYDYIKPLPGDTWTNISYGCYGNIDLWWLIALTNNVYNPFEMPKYLKIIKPEYIDTILANIQSQLQ